MRRMCGVVGLIGTPDAAREAFLGLTTLQHRGQDAAGILSYDASGFHRVKNLGLVESVFTRENISSLTGNLAVGHVRYSTIGKGDLIDVQPFLLSYPFGLGMVHNGNIVNCQQLARELKDQNQRHLLTHSDTEVVLNLFAEGLARYPSAEGVNGLAKDHHSNFERICSAASSIFQRVNGSYSIATVIADQGLVAFRDPQGLRPLIWGKKTLSDGKEAHMVASESVALFFLGYEIVRDIQPGEVLFIDLQGNISTRVVGQKRARHCMFEWVYFASPESVIDGVPVYGTRLELGKNLAHLVRKEMKERHLEADIVVPVPETSRIAAIALAEELKIPYREVLIKNRYIKRTFILDSQEKRQSAVNLKLSPVRSEIQGKRVLLVDDSIVRGTTSRKIIELVRNAGASKVYFVSTCPPIQHPCFYGIDFPVKSELIASGQNLSAIEKDLGADAVIYQTIQGLESSVEEAASSRSRPSSKERTGLCMACLTGEYPTDVTVGSQFAQARLEARDTDKKGKQKEIL
jgi:amidophosphoribosyltransferase